MKAILAVDKNFGIGKNGKLLAHLPKDMQFFKEKTKGKVVIMGRKTLESLPNSKPLPNRVNIVITNNKNYTAPEGVILLNSRDDVIEYVSRFEKEDVFVIGGEMIYKLFLSDCSEIFVTKILHDFNADRFFIDIDKNKEFRLAESSEIVEDNGYKLRFCRYERVQF